MNKAAWISALALASFTAVAGAAPASTTASVPAPTWLDTPAWAKGDQLELTWIVGYNAGGTTPETSKAPLELVATIGSVSRHLKLDNQLGSLKPDNEAVCNGHAYPLATGDVAKIAFYEGGAGGYVARRVGSDAIAIVSWNMGDGRCTDKAGKDMACPTNDKVVAQLHVPANVKIHQTLVQIDAKGARHPFACK